MSDIFIVDLFIFKSTKILPSFAASNQHFTGMPEYIKHMILNTLQVFYKYHRNNLHHLSISYNIYSFSVLSLCVCKLMRCLNNIPYIYI